MEIMTIMSLVVVGIFIGLMVTLIGGGGGALKIPILVFGFGLTLKQSAPISLISMIFTSFFGSVSHIRHKNVHFQGGLLAVTGTLIGTGVGVFIHGLINELVLARSFGILMFLMIYPMWVKMRSKHEKLNSQEICREVCILQHPFRYGWFITAMIFFIGLISGISAGLFGVSGVVTLIVGFYLIGIKPKVIVGTSIFILLFKSLSGLFWYAMSTSLSWDIIIALGVGNSIGALLGPGLLAKFDTEKVEFYLERAFIGIIILLGILFLFKKV